MTTSSFATFLQEKITERGWNLRKVSEMTGISVGHLEHLVRGEMGSLPAAPYLRGYVAKLGEALGFDPEPWWKAIQSGTLVSRSGATDEMPRNRFSRAPVGRFAWLIVVLIAAVIYIIVRFASIFGLPSLTIVVPETDTITTTTEVVMLRGTLTNGNALKINSDPVPVNPDGSWEKEVTLHPGSPNIYSFTAEKFLGRSRTVVREIVYTPLASSTPADGGNTGATGTSTDDGTSSSTSSSTPPGTTTIIF
jgi:transcriptional regulator with XRE-family HTH domain